MKNIIEKIKERIKKSNFIKWLKFKSIIRDLEGKISVLSKEKDKLIDLSNTQKNEIKHFKNNDIKVATYEVIIEATDKELKKKAETIKKQGLKIRELNKNNDNLTAQLMNMELEMKKWKIQAEEYEAQIQELHTEGRFLIKKIKSKTKKDVIKYMKGIKENV